MNKNFYNFQLLSIENGLQELVDNIKLLLYKYDPGIFDLIDFDDDKIYLEPLLFAYFNASPKGEFSLNSILAGYYKNKESIRDIIVESDPCGRIYLPAHGWLLTNNPNKKFILNSTDGTLILNDGERDIDYKLQPIQFIEGTNIELVKYGVPLLDQYYYDPKHNLINVEIEEISRRHNSHIKLAFDLIRAHAPEHFQLIETVTQKCVIFNVDTTLRNSFATLSAQGIGFFNACQNTYNEVFFVDDIAHQTGHLIFNALTYDVAKFIQVPPSLVLDTVTLTDGSPETRDVHIIFHALYTYYTTFICLDACLKAEAFVEHKKHEAMGRMAFYIRKCYSDLLLIEKPKSEEHTSDKLFTPEGLVIYDGIKNIFLEMTKEWGPAVKYFELNDQPYNFNYSIFLLSNPIHELS